MTPKTGYTPAPYAQARSDFEYLETFAELDDQVELDAERQNLMRDPTKARAARMYESAIGLWFAEHPDFDAPRLRRIAGRYL